MKLKYHILEMYYILTSSSTPDMDTGVECHIFKANPAGNIYSKYQWFVKIWTSKNIDTEIPHFNMYKILTSSPTLGHGSWGTMSWKESQPYRVPMVQV